MLCLQIACNNYSVDEHTKRRSFHTFHSSKHTRLHRPRHKQFLVRTPGMICLIKDKKINSNLSKHTLLLKFSTWIIQFSSGYIWCSAQIFKTSPALLHFHSLSATMKMPLLSVVTLTGQKIFLQIFLYFLLES